MSLVGEVVLTLGEQQRFDPNLKERLKKFFKEEAGFQKPTHYDGLLEVV